MWFKHYRNTLLLVAMMALLVASMTQFAGGPSSASGAPAAASAHSQAQPPAPNRSADLKAGSQSEWQRLTYPAGYLPGQVVPQALAWRAQHNPDAAPAGFGTPAHKAANPQSPIPLVPGQWTSLGPQPLLSGNINTGGRVTALAVDPTNAAVVYAGMADGGVWKTTNCCSTSTTLVTSPPTPPSPLQQSARLRLTPTTTIPSMSAPAKPTTVVTT